MTLLSGWSSPPVHLFANSFKTRGYLLTRNATNKVCLVMIIHQKLENWNECSLPLHRLSLPKNRCMQAPKPRCTSLQRVWGCLGLISRRAWHRRDRQMETSALFLPQHGIAFMLALRLMLRDFIAVGETFFLSCVRQAEVAPSQQSVSTDKEPMGAIILVPFL